MEIVIIRLLVAIDVALSKLPLSPEDDLGHRQRGGRHLSHFSQDILIRHGLAHTVLNALGEPGRHFVSRAQDCCNLLYCGCHRFSPLLTDVPALPGARRAPSGNAGRPAVIPGDKQPLHSPPITISSVFSIQADVALVLCQQFGRYVPVEHGFYQHSPVQFDRFQIRAPQVGVRQDCPRQVSPL